MTDHHHCQQRTCLYFTVSVCAISEVFTPAQTGPAVPTSKNLPYNEVSKYANLFRLGSCSVQNFTLVPLDIFDISQDRQDRPGLSLSLAGCVSQTIRPLSRMLAGAGLCQDCSNHHFIEVTQLQSVNTTRLASSPASEEDQKTFSAGRAGTGDFLGSKVVEGRHCEMWCSSFVRMNVGVGQPTRLTPFRW